MPSVAQLSVGDQLRWDARTWTLAALEGTRATLADEAGSIATVLLHHLFADPLFEVIGAAPRRSIRPRARHLPEPVREQALAWERHVREVEQGTAGPGG